MRGTGWQALADGLVFFDGRLHRADRDPEVLRRDPVRLMKVFWHLHRLGCDFSLGLERAVEELMKLLPEAPGRLPARPAPPIKTEALP